MHVVGAQKNLLNGTVLLSTQNICSNDGLENIYNLTLKNCVYLNLCCQQTKFDRAISLKAAAERAQPNHPTQLVECQTSDQAEAN